MAASQHMIARGEKIFPPRSVGQRRGGAHLFDLRTLVSDAHDRGSSTPFQNRQETFAMKRQILATLLIGAATIAHAQQKPEDHTAHHPGQTAPAQKTAPTMPSSEGTHGSEMQGKMKEMQALMDRLAATKDPSERQRLLAQHRQAMREQLDSMMRMDCRVEMAGTRDQAKSSDSMMKPGMPRMSSPAGAAEEPAPGGQMMGQGVMTGAGMMKCHEQMQARMKLMLGMMDQMIQHEDAERRAH